LSIIGLESNVPLDIDTLYRQVAEMVAGISATTLDQQLADARDVLRQVDPQALRHKLRRRERGTVRIPWLMAEPVDTLAGIFPPPPLPPDLSVVASDGSSIPPDRHSPVRYFVLNMGYTVLTYGSAPGAILGAQERFCFKEDDLYFQPLGKRIPIEGTRLGILMGIEEIDALMNAARLAISPVVALRDGSLILWNLQSEDQDLQHDYLGRFLAALDTLCEVKVPVASYVSFPGSSDVANSLRLMLCDDESRSCSRCPQQTEEQTLCQFMGSLRDRQLFDGLLRPGERSDIFESQSAILERYREHHIQFFYLDVGGEIVRIEAPQWVMNDPQMLDLVHSALFDQCQRSGQYPPYPPALIEAHEQAVISTADRQAVQQMIEQALAECGVFYLRSAKDRSKRSRGV
jgi:hypothetical protein